MNAAVLAVACLAVRQAEPIKVQETETQVFIETKALEAKINKKGYVSGIAAGSFLDRKTGARELGVGLHIMDFLLGPGWRDDDYSRDRKVHGDLPKHYVEGPQICTQAKELKPEVIEGKDFVALRLRYRFHKPGAGFKATWVQVADFLRSGSDAWEIIFVCDGCTDGTPLQLAEWIAARPLPVRMISYATNRGKVWSSS